MTEVSFAKSFLTTLDNKPTKYQPNHIFDPNTFGVRAPFTLPKLPPPPDHPLPPKPQNDVSSVASAPIPGASKATTTTNILNVTLKSTKNPSFTYTLSSAPPSTTIASIKEQLHTYLGGSSTVSSIDKIKILYQKKPVPASKSTIADVVTDPSAKELELGVLIMGGAPDPAPQSQSQSQEKQDPASASAPTPTTATGITTRKPEAAGPGSENAAVEAETGVNPSDQTVTSHTPDVTSTIAPEESRGEHPVQPGEESGKEVLQTTEFWSDLEGFLSQRLRSQEEAGRLRGVFERTWRSAEARP